ncbi:3'-5' exonuclease [Promicromonospora sp. NPDC023987]|uniref:3'-5' exonuclease n=1 Tax=Promicromonospora sp. NPDC023987 TaxID=3155360 RepID=UPI0034005392
MPQVIIPSDIPPLDGSIRSQAYAFIDKLRKDDTTPGLHIEPMAQAADPRARTGRVNQFWRAVLIKLTGSHEEPHYVYLGTFPHDDAIAYARSVVFQRNPRTSAAEVIRVDFGGVPKRTTEPLTRPVREDDSPTISPILQQHGVTFEDLVDLGLSAQVAHDALHAANQDGLLNVAVAVSGFQSEALLLLGTGQTVEQVRTSLKVEPVTGGTEHDTDDDLIGALDHPVARMQFTYLQDDEELRAAIEDENFARWRTFLHPEQKEHVSARTRGAFRLSGGAGTGKTVVLVHRARAMHRKNPDARIVLCTFNRTLANLLKSNLLLLDKTVRLARQPGDPGVYVGTVDSIARSVIIRASDRELDLQRAVAELLGRPRSDVARPTPDSVWEAALGDAGHDLPASLRTAEFFTAEYGAVVIPARITTREAYLHVRRHGRGVALARAQRNGVWDVIEAYRSAASALGTLDYDEKAMVAAMALDTAFGTRGRRVTDHVLVDEAQDLNPARLVLVRALVASGPDDVFLAEDSQQRIYAPRTVLSRHGLQVTGRSRRLLLNYRTTAQNLDYAVSILAGHEIVDLEDSVIDGTGIRSARSGPPPATIGCGSLEAAYETAARTLQEWLADGTPAETIAVLVRTGNDGTALSRALARQDIPNQYYGADTTPGAGRICVLTMHRSKGMEFRNVIVFGATTSAAKSFDHLPEGDRPDVLQRERSLLYVATTRARDRVALVWHGARSELLPEHRPARTPESAPAEVVAIAMSTREAVAREMHDGMGHSLIQIALQASMLEALAAEHPELREIAAMIRSSAKRAGDELRDILTALESGADGVIHVSFDDLTQLLMNLKNQGVRITSSVSISDGQTADLTLTRACYRLVQESLTNAMKHAPDLPIDIVLRGNPTTGVTIVVRNALSTSALPSLWNSGTGLAGMTDRATNLGGSLAAGPIGAQFVVDIRLPWIAAR